MGSGGKILNFFRTQTLLGWLFNGSLFFASVRAVGAASVASLDARRVPQSATSRKIEREKKYSTSSDYSFYKHSGHSYVFFVQNASAVCLAVSPRSTGATSAVRNP
jgi:hypothetical protein